MTKRLLSAMLALSIAAVVVGCGEETTTGPSTTPTPKPTTTSAPATGAATSAATSSATTGTAH